MMPTSLPSEMTNNAPTPVSAILDGLIDRLFGVTDQISLPLRFKTELILSLSLNICAPPENQAVPPTSCLAG
jgi:hypothetical protein